METLTPEVSVILPVRQWQASTSTAIASILAQSMTSLELLLIGQQDIEELVAKAPQDPRIRVIPRCQPGIVGALNTGLATARGNFLARMDDDDLAYPDRLARQLQHLRGSSGTELCSCRIRFIDANGNAANIGRGNREYARWLNSLTKDTELRTACFIECPMPHPTLMAHRDIWQRIGPYRDIDAPEDYDLVLRAILLGIRLGKPQSILQDWREHPERLTYRHPRYRHEAFAYCRALAVVDPRSNLEVAEGRKVWLCGTGRHARRWHDALQQLGARVEGFVDVHRNGPHRSKRGKPVISYEQLPGKRCNSLVISAVTGLSARTALLDYFRKQLWREGREFILGG